ncbi:MAG: hypothetical protein ABNH26_08560 [Celeribacter sp.]|jgi:hypothetical protein
MAMLSENWLEQERDRMLDAADRRNRDEAASHLSRAQTTVRTYQAQSRPMDRDRPARRLTRAVRNWLSRTDYNGWFVVFVVLVSLQAAFAGHAIYGAMSDHNATRLERSE